MLKSLSLTLVASALVLATAASSPASAHGGGFRGANFGRAFAARSQSFARTGGFRRTSYAIVRGYPCYLCGHPPPRPPINPVHTTNPANGGNSETCRYIRSVNPSMFPPGTICYAQ
jgi:hypothetical protein